MSRSRPVPTVPEKAEARLAETPDLADLLALMASLALCEWATGADSLARTWAAHRDIPVITERADWKAHGRGAGPRRNQKMLDEHRPDVVIAFAGGAGTGDMVKRAKAAGVPVFDFRDWPADAQFKVGRFA